MNANSLKIMRQKRWKMRIWFFKYGFGFWIGRVMLTVGHDIRSAFVMTKGKEQDND